MTALLEEALARDTKKVGVVKAGPDENGLYRVRIGDSDIIIKYQDGSYRDWETDRKSTRLNSSHSAKSRMPSSA